MQDCGEPACSCAITSGGYINRTDFSCGCVCACGEVGFKKMTFTNIYWLTTTWTREEEGGGGGGGAAVVPDDDQNDDVDDEMRGIFATLLAEEGGGVDAIPPSRLRMCLAQPLAILVSLSRESLTLLRWGSSQSSLINLIATFISLVISLFFIRRWSSTSAMETRSFP